MIYTYFWYFCCMCVLFFLNVVLPNAHSFICSFFLLFLLLVGAWGFSFLPPGPLQMLEDCQRTSWCQSSKLWGSRGKGNLPMRMPVAWTFWQLLTPGCQHTHLCILCLLQHISSVQQHWMFFTSLVLVSRESIVDLQYVDAALRICKSTVGTSLACFIGLGYCCWGDTLHSQLWCLFH